MNIEEIKKQADGLSYTAYLAEARVLARLVVMLCEHIADLEETKLDNPEYVVAPAEAAALFTKAREKMPLPELMEKIGESVQAPNAPKLSHRDLRARV